MIRKKLLAKTLVNGILPILLVLTVTAFFIGPRPPARGVTQVYPPYQDATPDGKIIGTSVDTMACAMTSVGQTYTLEIVRGQQWAEAQSRVKAGELDFFFGALHTQGRDEYAVWSAALDLNRTYFISRHGAPLRSDPKARWGVKKGSGISAQMQDTMVNITLYAEDNPQLVDALNDGEIDYLYMDIEIFRWGHRVNGLVDGVLGAIKGSPDYIFDTVNFHFEPVADQLYGAYFSRRWLRDNPGFMDRLNAAIGDCRVKKELPR